MNRTRDKHPPRLARWGITLDARLDARTAVNDPSELEVKVHAMGASAKYVTLTARCEDRQLDLDSDLPPDPTRNSSERVLDRILVARPDPATFVAGVGKCPVSRNGNGTTGTDAAVGIASVLDLTPPRPSPVAGPPELTVTTRLA